MRWTDFPTWAFRFMVASSVVQPLLWLPSRMELQGAFSSVEKSIVVAWLVGALVVALATLAVSLPELGPKALKRWKLWATVVFVSGIVPVWLFVLAALWYFGLFPPFMGS